MQRMPSMGTGHQRSSVPKPRHRRAGFQPMPSMQSMGTGPQPSFSTMHRHRAGFQSMPSMPSMGRDALNAGFAADDAGLDAVNDRFAEHFATINDNFAARL
eukprot:651319_1